MNVDIVIGNLKKWTGSDNNLRQTKNFCNRALKAYTKYFWTKSIRCYADRVQFAHKTNSDIEGRTNTTMIRRNT